MKQTEEKLDRELAEKKADVKLAEFRVEEFSSRLERTQKWHEDDLKKLAFKLDRNEKLKDLLENDY